MTAIAQSEPRLAPGSARTWSAVLLVFAIGSVANGLWMLIDPGHWYEHLPAGVPDTGPLNGHFVRDIGCAFVTMGAALFMAWRRPQWRAPLVAVVALFYVLHALLHVHDTALGLVDAHHWWLDMPGVYIPAVVLLFAARHFHRSERGETR